MARFVGKRLVYASAGDAVRNADALLEKAVSGKAPIYHADTPSEPVICGSWAAKLRPPDERRFSHDPRCGGGRRHHSAVAAVAAARPACQLDDDDEKCRLCGLCHDVPVLAAFIASSIGDRPAFMPGLLGGYLAQMGTTTLTNLSWISSGFWGALIGGFAAGLIVLLLNRLLDRIPQELSHIKTGLLVPTCSLLFIGWLMLMIVNPPLGRFNRWMSLCLSKMQGGSRLLLGALLGGMMATDYGGPINKAAYVSGTLALVTLQYDLMAAVMGGRHGPAAGAGAGLYAVPDKIHRLGAPQRAPDCDHGTFLRDGGRSALRPARPASCRPLLYCRQCAGRLFGHLPRLRLPRPPWRIVSATRNGKSARLSGCAARRKLLAALLLGLLKKPLKQ